VRGRLVLTIDNCDLAVFAIGVVGEKLRQRLLRGAPLREQADREIVVARIGSALRESRAGIRAQRTVAVEPGRNRIAGDSDAELPAAWAAGDQSVSHASLVRGPGRSRSVAQGRSSKIAARRA